MTVAKGDSHQTNFYSSLWPLAKGSYCYIVGLGLNCKFIDLLFKHSVIKFIKISSHFGFIVSEIIYNQTDTLTQRLIHQRQF